MSVERRKEILEKLSNGEITATEAAKLLNQPATPPPPPTAAPTPVKAAPAPAAADKGATVKGATWLHVHVDNLATGDNKVTVNIPLSVASLGFRIAQRFTPELSDLDFDEISQAMNGKDDGLLVEVKDKDGNEHVRVFVS